MEVTVKSRNEKKPCPQCGKPLNGSYITNHLRTVHGIRGGTSGRVRRNAQEMANGTMPPAATLVKRTPRVPPSAPGTLTPLPARLYVDDNGNMWIAEPFGGASAGGASA